MLKIITVCGLGVGSSLIMKMTVDSACAQLGVKCGIEHWDMGLFDKYGGCEGSERKTRSVFSGAWDFIK